MNDFRIRLDFRSYKLASNYFKLVEERDGQKLFDAELLGVGGAVSLQLPEVVTKIVASTKYNGFYLVFEDLRFAKWCEESLLIFKLVEGSRSKVYIDRRLESPEACIALGIYPKSEPAAAIGSGFHARPSYTS